MARKPKSVYERITEKKQEIQLVQEKLQSLTNELLELESEQDDLEMHQLLIAARAKGLNIEQALAKIAK